MDRWASELRTPASFQLSSTSRRSPSRRSPSPAINDRPWQSKRERPIADTKASRSSHREEASPRRVASPARTGGRGDRRAATIKLGGFSGTNVPLETHLAKLRNCSEYYGWSSSDRLCHLKASLEGNAAAILWELRDDCSEADLLDILRSRYGDREQIERFRFELKTRRRRKGETIQALHQDVCRLLALSYPGETGSLSRVVARDAFLDSLNDPEMRIRILEKDAKTIEEAYAIAAQYEAYLAGSLSSDDGDRRSVRVVNSRTDSVDSDRDSQRRLEATVAKLQDSLGSLMQSLAQHQPAVAPPVPPPM